MADKTRSHYQASEEGSLWWDSPGWFLQNFDGLLLLLLLLLLPPLSPLRYGRGETSEMEIKMLPKDFIHIQAFMHLTKASKGRGRDEEERREKGGGGATCCLNIHSPTWSRVVKSECRTKRWWCPCPDKGEGELGVSVMKSLLFALHYEQVVVGISCCGSTHPCGSDCFVVNLSISPQWWLLQIPFGKYDGGAIRQGQGR